MDSMELVTRMDDAPTSLRARIDPLREQIERLLEQQADDRAWSDELGPVYTQSQVSTLLDKSKQAVSSDRTLLRLTMRSGRVGYPVFQFDGDVVVKGVRDIVEILTPAVATSWTIASWLTSPQPDTGHSAMELLRAGRVDDVVAAARRSASRMSH